MEYAGFWRRFGAYWIDMAVLLPLLAVTYVGSQWSRLFFVFWFLPGLIVALWFNVYLVHRYGGTPGKLLLKTRISMVDGSPVTIKAAAIRYLILFILSTACSAATVIGTLSMTDEMYFSVSQFYRGRMLLQSAPSWYHVCNALLEVWTFSEFITMLFNKKRRAVHDFIAGTVVIKSAPSKSPSCPAVPELNDSSLA